MHICGGDRPTSASLLPSGCLDGTRLLSSRRHDEAQERSRASVAFQFFTLFVSVFLTLCFSTTPSLPLCSFLSLSVFHQPLYYRWSWSPASLIVISTSYARSAKTTTSKNAFDTRHPSAHPGRTLYSCRPTAELPSGPSPRLINHMVLTTTKTFRHNSSHEHADVDVTASTPILARCGQLCTRSDIRKIVHLRL